jgi:hypothetical protein
VGGVGRGQLRDDRPRLGHPPLHAPIGLPQLRRQHRRRLPQPRHRRTRLLLHPREASREQLPLLRLQPRSLRLQRLHPAGELLLAAQPRGSLRLGRTGQLGHRHAALGDRVDLIVRERGKPLIPLAVERLQQLLQLCGGAAERVDGARADRGDVRLRVAAPLVHDRIPPRATDMESGLWTTAERVVSLMVVAGLGLVQAGGGGGRAWL